MWSSVVVCCRCGPAGEVLLPAGDVVSPALPRREAKHGHHSWYVHSQSTLALIKLISLIGSFILLIAVVSLFWLCKLIYLANYC